MRLTGKESQQKMGDGKDCKVSSVQLFSLIIDSRSLTTLLEMMMASTCKCLVTPSSVQETEPFLSAGRWRGPAGQGACPSGTTCMSPLLTLPALTLENCQFGPELLIGRMSWDGMNILLIVYSA